MNLEVGNHDPESPVSAARGFSPAIGGPEGPPDTPAIRKRRRSFRTATVGLCLVALAWIPLGAQTVETVTVVARRPERKVHLPGELLPFLQVGVHSRVTGFVDEVRVDRGSQVRKGDVLVTLVAPELAAQAAEALARARALDAQAAEARAKLEAAESTLSRLRAAAATEGAVAGNEVLQAQKAAEAAQSSQRALEESARAAHAAAEAARDLQSYLTISAPFDGTITERTAHPGTLVGPAAGPLLGLEQQNRLRLVVGMPETEVTWVTRGDRVTFTVPACPGQSFQAEVSRLSGSIDPKTRTMAVELDVPNSGRVLAPGMYPDVVWTLHRAQSSLLVPPSSIVTTTERTFVIRVRGGRAEWVTVTKGQTSGDLVEVTGVLQAGDEIVRRGSDEIRQDSKVTTRRVDQK
jgi:membrane fusion protein, multidrug efflux system